MRVLLTGGAGFIGSHLAARLLDAGYHIAVVDDLNDFYSPAMKRANLASLARSPRFSFYALDICHAEALRAVFARHRPELLIHLAARVGVRASLSQPWLYERVNFHGTLTLLNLCRDFPPEKFLFASSSSVYGNSSPVPFSEDIPYCLPISPYGVTKLAGEWLCRNFAEHTGVPTLCLRLFSVYGPRQRPDLVLHKFTRLIERGEEVPVLGDGSGARDYTYIDDILTGLLAAIEYTGSRFEVINLGNNRPVVLNDLLTLLEAKLGRPARRRQLPPSSADMQQTWANIEKAQRLLNYQPQTTLEDGVEEFLRWYRAQAAK